MTTIQRMTAYVIRVRNRSLVRHATACFTLVFHYTSVADSLWVRIAAFAHDETAPTPSLATKVSVGIRIQASLTVTTVITSCEQTETLLCFLEKGARVARSHSKHTLFITPTVTSVTRS